MNIFYLHSDPKVAASYFYDKHKVKMILECAQMLCTAHIALGNEDVPYKKSHLNHPSSVWVRANNENYQWLYNHMLALGEEYTKRYKRTHLTITKCKDILAVAPLNIPTGSFNEPPQCMPDEYKVDNDSVSAYWNYYEQDKYKIANKNEQKIIRPLNINELCEH
jgi:hypothetical protein|tara:strand:- start:680 stop:1171 length:492 start_codon:yes stop_codon:yes gene_type:complete